MTEKPKSKTNAIIAGRKIEVVTDMSIDECKRRLYRIELRELVIRTDRKSADLMKFEMNYGSWSQSTKMIGEIQRTSDHQTLVSAEVLLQDTRIMYSIIITLATMMVCGLACAFSLGLNSIPFLVVFAILLPISFVDIFRRAKEREILLLHLVRAMLMSSSASNQSGAVVSINHSHFPARTVYEVQTPMSLYDCEYRLYQFMANLNAQGNTTDVDEDTIKFKFRGKAPKSGISESHLHGMMRWDEQMGMTIITLKGILLAEAFLTDLGISPNKQKVASRV